MKPYLLIVLLFISFISCKKIEVKPDTQNPDLPAYSENGHDVGGVLINDTAWLTEKTGFFLSRARPFQLFSYPNGDSIVIIFNGDFKDSTLRFINRSVFIVLKNIKIVTDNDLLQLNGKNFVLNGNNNYGGFSDYAGYNKVGKAVGQVSFGKVSLISNVAYGDGSLNNPRKHQYIITGLFNMNFFTTRSISLTKGRFDMTALRDKNLLTFF